MVNSETKQQGRKLFFGLFIFPLLIAVGMALLLCTVVLLTREVETPESLITSIKTGSPSKRWQKAFELSNELNQGRGLIRESGVMNEVIHILNDRKEYDAKTRSYMAIALSRFEEEDAGEALLNVLGTETDPDVELYLMWGLGQRRVTAATPVIIPYLRSDNEDLKKMASYVLGVIGNAEAVPALVPLVESPLRDVRWNAALSLARLGDDRGFEELKNMVDRPTLSSMEGMNEARIEEVMINAVKGLALINQPGTEEILKQLSKTDKSLKVRQAALDSLGLINQKVRE